MQASWGIYMNVHPYVCDANLACICYELSNDKPAASLRVTAGTWAPTKCRHEQAMRKRRSQSAMPTEQTQAPCISRGGCLSRRGGNEMLDYKGDYRQSDWCMLHAYCMWVCGHNTTHTNGTRARIYTHDSHHSRIHNRLNVYLLETEQNRARTKMLSQVQDH